jgi:hypothetical protein
LARSKSARSLKWQVFRKPEPELSKRAAFVRLSGSRRCSSGEPEVRVKYLCLTFQDESKIDELSLADADAREAEAARLLSELRACGNHIASAPAIPPHAATTVRVRNGRLVITDGASAAGREQIAGFYVLEARDLNEALRLAARVPAARTGYVEVRPLPDLLLDAAVWTTGEAPVDSAAIQP